MTAPAEALTFPERLERGQEFQDWIADRLIDQVGLALSNYTSKVRALRKENRQGIEIKWDGRFRQTGNLFVELAKRPEGDPTGPFLPSGISGPGQPWALVQGDYSGAWFLPAVSLRLVEPVCQHAENDFARGFLLPLVEADTIAAFKIEPNGGTK